MENRRTTLVRCLTRAAVATVVLAPPLAAQENAAVDAHVLRPKEIPATPERVRSLKVADGLAVSVFAEGLGGAAHDRGDARGRRVRHAARAGGPVAAEGR